MKSRSFALLFAIAALTPGLARAADRSFDTLVRGVETEFGVHKTYIPMVGLAKLFISVASPAGVHQLDLATFEDVRWTPESADRFRSIVRRSLGDGWSPMVQVYAPGRKEYTTIYCGSNGGHWRLIVATIEAHEATLVELRLDPRELAAWIHDPESANHRSGHGSRAEADDSREQ